MFRILYEKSHARVTLEIIPEKDRKFLSLFPLIATWIRKKKILSDNELSVYCSLYSEQIDIALATPESKMLEFLDRYRNDGFYGNYIKVMLSHEGIEWLRGTLRRLRELRGKGK
jgi:hypothetical protein